MTILNTWRNIWFLDDCSCLLMGRFFDNNIARSWRFVESVPRIVFSWGLVEPIPRVIFSWLVDYLSGCCSDCLSRMRMRRICDDYILSIAWPWRFIESIPRIVFSWRFIEPIPRVIFSWLFDNVSCCSYCLSRMSWICDDYILSIARSWRFIESVPWIIFSWGLVESIPRIIFSWFSNILRWFSWRRCFSIILLFDLLNNSCYSCLLLRISFACIINCFYLLNNIRSCCCLSISNAFSSYNGCSWSWLLLIDNILLRINDTFRCDNSSCSSLRLIKWIPMRVYLSSRINIRQIF